VGEIILSVLTGITSIISTGMAAVCNTNITGNKIHLFLYLCDMHWGTYIISDKDILLGKPTIRGTRISVELILELLSNGWTESMILESYPQLSLSHLHAVFSYLKECMQQELYFPLPKTA
jgi:uncharacterized protein (DUF433 family)